MISPVAYSIPFYKLLDTEEARIFRAVAKLENVTKAAKELYVSQPALSQSIARLEDSLGVELFDRRGGKLHLNAAGRLFLSRAENAFIELNTGFSEVDFQQLHYFTVVAECSCHFYP